MTISQAMSIAQNNTFRDRIQFLMIKAAVANLNGETPSSATVLLGQRILKGQENVSLWAIAAITNATIMAGAHQDDGSTIIDSDLEFVINSLWTAFSL